MPTNSQHERVILYASRSRVEEGTVFPSTEAQLVRLEQDAQLRGQVIVAAFAEEGWSGKSLRGPKLKAALALYRSLGFLNVTPDAEWQRQYQRATIFMKLESIS